MALFNCHWRAVLHKWREFHKSQFLSFYGEKFVSVHPGMIEGSRSWGSEVSSSERKIFKKVPWKCIKMVNISKIFLLPKILKYFVCSACNREPAIPLRIWPKGLTHPLRLFRSPCILCCLRWIRAWSHCCSASKDITKTFGSWCGVCDSSVCIHEQGSPSTKVCVLNTIEEG